MPGAARRVLRSEFSSLLAESVEHVRKVQRGIIASLIETYATCYNTDKSGELSKELSDLVSYRRRLRTIVKRRLLKNQLKGSVLLCFDVSLTYQASLTLKPEVKRRGKARCA